MPHHVENTICFIFFFTIYYLLPITVQLLEYDPLPEHVPVLEHVPLLKHAPVLEHVPELEHVPALEHPSDEEWLGGCR